MQVKHFERRRLLWVFQHAPHFVETVQVVPLWEELLQFEAIVQVLSQLAWKSKAADTLQVLEESDDYVLLDAIVPPLHEKFEPIVKGTVLIKSLIHSS